MPSLKDAAELTEQLQELTAQLHSELTEGEVDFDRMIELADRISEHADGLAGAFNTVNDALSQRISQVRDGSQGDEQGESEESGSQSKRGGS
ncbi:MAG: hypothetical protein ICV64_09145 [Thermoleophilia bacterium]|nr:hypothetical protein [Thermoleophilia bacterium]